MKATQWTGHEDNMWQPTGPTTDQLPPGYYKLNPGGMFSPWGLVCHKLMHDQVIPTGLAQTISSDIDTFLRKRDHYRRFGFLHKRGIMMSGAPGIGKTMTAMLLCKHVIAAKGIAISCPDPLLVKAGFLAHALLAIREVHPEMPILNLIEDIDQVYRLAATSLLSILDGENQVDNIIHIATTNFIERLDSRITNRPGRFDRVVIVSPPDTDTRRHYLKQILPPDTAPALIEEMATKTDGFYLSHLHGLIAAHVVQEQPLDEVLTAFKAMNTIKSKPSESTDDNKQAQLFALANYIERTAYSIESSNANDADA